MPVPVTLPDLGESVTEGTVTRWLKSGRETRRAARTIAITRSFSPTGYFLAPATP